MRPVVAVDVEGNGQHPDPDLIEVGVTPIIDGVVGPSQTWLIRPPRPITWRVTQIHGIANADVQDAPPIQAIAAELLTVLSEATVVGHNVGVDVRALQRGLPGWRPIEVVDTLTLARQTVPGLASYAMAALVDEFDLAESQPQKGAHRAGWDSRAAALLYLRLVRNAGVQGILSI